MARVKRCSWGSGTLAVSSCKSQQRDTLGFFNKPHLCSCQRLCSGCQSRFSSFPAGIPCLSPGDCEDLFKFPFFSCAPPPSGHLAGFCQLQARSDLCSHLFPSVLSARAARRALRLGRKESWGWRVGHPLCRKRTLNICEQTQSSRDSTLSQKRWQNPTDDRREQGTAGGQGCARHAQFWDCPALTEAEILGEKDANASLKIDLTFGSTEGWEQLLSVFSCVCNNPKIHSVIFPGRLCFSVQCLGERKPQEQRSNFVGMKLIFGQNASLNCHFLLFLEFFQKMLAAY